MSKPKPYEFCGPLAKTIEGFIAEKQAVGYDYVAVRARMCNFDRFSIGFDTPSSVLPKELVDGWLTKNENETAGNHRQKLYAMLEFGKYMIRNGCTAYLPLKKSRPAASKNFVPYIFNTKELSDILYAIDAMPNPVNHTHLSLIYGGIYRILCCCGLRISEALNLKVENVDLKQGVLTVLDSKLGKNKLIPMDESLTLFLMKYADLHHHNSKNEDYFFPSKTGGLYTVSAFYQVFRKCLWKAQISHGGVGNGPRVHDLRHTFSVNCLKKWAVTGVDVASALPILSAYLGHESISSTQHYLRLTAEVFPHITSVLEEHYGDIIPEIGECDYESY